MKELDTIIRDLKQCLANKEDEISASPGASSHIISALHNRKLEVALFEKSSREVKSDPTQKTNIINNFTKGANELKDAINNIG
jgi:hypothetical protein